MACIDVVENSPGGVVLCEKSGSEAQAALAVGAGVLIHVRYKFRQSNLGGGKRLEAGLESRHQHGGRNALAGDVGYGEDDAILFVGLPRPRKHVVVVSGDGVGRAGGVGNRDSANLRW